MSNEMNQAGNFRVQITEYYLTEKESGSVAITAYANVLDRWMLPTDDVDGYWEPWQQHDVVVRGDFYIVGKIAKGGKLNDKLIEALIQFCGWDGNIQSIHSGSWQPVPCRMSVEDNTYEGKITYRMGWPADFNTAPGGQRLNDAGMKRIESKHASAMRAIAGNVKRNAAPPTEKPPSPPPVDNAMVVTGEAATPNVGNDEIPF